MSVRAYLPTTPEGLSLLVSTGTLPPEALGEPVVAPDDDEESEYAALMAAADLSTALAGQRGGAARRRVVVVAEVAEVAAEVAVARVTIADVVAVHLDTEDRAHDADPDDDLAWFAPEELAHLA